MYRTVISSVPFLMFWERCKMPNTQIKMLIVDDEPTTRLLMMHNHNAD
jgi:hypothetical protein